MTEFPDRTGSAALPEAAPVLTLVLRRLHADRVLALVAVRQPVGSLPDGLLRVAAARGCRMTLPPLDEGEMARLARIYVDDLPDAAVQRLRRHTGGNPLHTRAVLTFTIGGGAGRYAGVGGSGSFTEEGVFNSLPTPDGCDPEPFLRTLLVTRATATVTR